MPGQLSQKNRVGANQIVGASKYIPIGQTWRLRLVSLTGRPLRTSRTTNPLCVLRTTDGLRPRFLTVSTAPRCVATGV